MISAEKNIPSGYKRNIVPGINYIFPAHSFQPQDILYNQFFRFSDNLFHRETYIRIPEYTSISAKQTAQSGTELTEKSFNYFKKILLHNSLFTKSITGSVFSFKLITKLLDNCFVCNIYSSTMIKLYLTGPGKIKFMVQKE